MSPLIRCHCQLSNGERCSKSSNHRYCGLWEHTAKNTPIHMSIKCRLVCCIRHQKRKRSSAAEDEAVVDTDTDDDDDQCVAITDKGTRCSRFAVRVFCSQHKGHRGQRIDYGDEAKTAAHRQNKLQSATTAYGRGPKLSKAKLRAIAENPLVRGDWRTGYRCRINNDGNWIECKDEQVRFRMNTRCFDAGGMRSAHLGEIQTDSKQTERVVFKIDFDGDENHAADVVAGDMMSLATASKYATMFNRLQLRNATVEFIPAQAIRKSTTTLYCPFEPVLDNKQYVKFNGNNGYMEKGKCVAKTPQEFSHYTYHASNGKLIVVDIQGVRQEFDDVIEYTFTDPQVCTTTGKGYGQGNAGRQAIEDFFQSHKCTDLCGGWKHIDD